MKNQNKDKGFTLVEILLAIFISTMMIGITVSQLSSSRTIFQNQEIELSTEDNARFVFDLLSVELAKAGYQSPDPSLVGTSPDTRLYSGSCPGLNGTCTSDGGGNDPDRIAIWFRPETGEDAIACNGTDIDGVLGTTNTVVYAYYIKEDDVTDLNSLYCETFSVNQAGIATSINNASDTVLSGIENMQLLYGIDDDSPQDGQPNRYISADQLQPQSGVSSVLISIIAGSGLSDGQGFGDQLSFELSGAPSITPAEGDYCYDNQCKVYSTAVSFRN